MASKLLAISFASLFCLLGLLAKQSWALGEFEPENHVLGTIEDENREAILLLDEASISRMKKTRTPSWKLVKQSQRTPVVFWHGMGDTAFGSINTDRLALQRKYPGLLVYSIQIGNNSFEDEMGGYFTNVNQQIEQACNEILSERAIRVAGAFNAVGFSQGAQFMRGLIQRCPLAENGIVVKNFISLGGQHQGVFGLPSCNGKSLICDHIRWLLTSAAYEPSVQNHVVQAEYWHDPLREELYKRNNVFLADINNELNMNDRYKANLLRLENLVLVQFTEDEMVVPRESSLFGFYAANQTEKIVPMELSSLYKKDRIGLKELDESGRLHQLKVAGGHLRYKMSWFIDEIAANYLDN